MPQSLSYDSGSFRERSSRVFYVRGRVRRGLDATALTHWQRLETTTFYHRFTSQGRLVATHRLDEPAADWAAVLEHQRVPVVSYPYEWCFGMLRDAARLHLEVLEAALQEGMSMSDGSAFNLQWCGVQPLFIDVPSFIRQDRPRPWTGYRQFCQHFLYPLLLQAHRQVPFQPWLRGQLDGLSLNSIRPLFGWRDVVRPGVALHVLLQHALQRLCAALPRDSFQDVAYSHTAALKLVRRLRRTVDRLHWQPYRSTWSHYEQRLPYAEAARQAKEAFVWAVASERRRSLVWDVGCNTGRFARLVSSRADTVLALDADAQAIEILYQTLRQHGPDNILPLVYDVTDPTPALGWRNAERRTLIDRGRPELLLALALIHHVVISGNIPLSEFIDWLADSADETVVEFIDRTDAMVHHLLVGRSDIFADYHPRLFEHHLDRRFHLLRREVLPGGTRTLYHVRSRAVEAPL